MVENAQRISVRVYYQDTDFSGRVYHAAYLRFLEQGRTEWLRTFGLQHNELAKSRGVTFAVVEMQLKFLAAAEVDDLLTVVTKVEATKGPILTFQQMVLHVDKTIATARIDVVTLRGNRPVKPLQEILTALPEVKRRWRDRSVR